MSKYTEIAVVYGQQDGLF